MPSNVGEFGNRVALWAKRTKKNLDSYIRNTCRELTEEIITNAPCDTGAYIGNWTPSVDVPYESHDFIPGPSKYRGGSMFKGGMTSVNRERAIAHVRRKLDMVIPLVSGTRVFYLSNGVRHARYVEFGGGATPPYAVVRNAMRKFKRRLAQSAAFGTGKWGGMWTWKKTE